MKTRLILFCAYLLFFQGVFAGRRSPVTLISGAADTNFLPLTAGSGSPLTGTLNGLGAYFSGNVGIGTSTPTQKLHVIGNIQAGLSSDFIWDAASGSLRVGFDGAQSVNGQTARLSINGAVKLGAHNCSSEVDIGQYGDLRIIGLYGAEVARINFTGMGIGTDNPTEKLCVNGNVRAKKVIVTQTGWSDYVFKKGYRLRSLASLQQFITTHNHLPDIPGAQEIETKGINVGENQALLLKKIEELTLYIIHQQKQIDLQGEEIKKIKHKTKT